MHDLIKRWKIFGGLVLDPWNLFTLIGLGFLLSVDSRSVNSLTNGLMSALTILASTVLGGRITNQWIKITEGGIVVARGKSAVRSLKLLLRSIAALESRVVRFLGNGEEIDTNPPVTRRNYEEIIETCNLLEEETVSSIENWTDIVPEADIKSQIGMISELKGTLTEKESDLSALKGQLEETQEESADERRLLGEEIREKTKQINKLNNKIFGLQTGLGGVGFISNSDLKIGKPGLLAEALKLSTSDKIVSLGDMLTLKDDGSLKFSHEDDDKD